MDFVMISSIFFNSSAEVDNGGMRTVGSAGG